VQLGPLFKHRNAKLKMCPANEQFDSGHWQDEVFSLFYNEKIFIISPQREIPSLNNFNIEKR